jgi:uncharacterized protein (DUF1697 family)
MTPYAAFLRGINVGGHKLVKMEDLNRIFASLKFKSVKTLIASGNVIFEAPKGDEKALARKIEAKLQASLGFEVPVMVRTLADIQKILKLNPFQKIKASPDVKNYVAFLYEKPKTKVKPPKAPPGETWEILAVKDLEIYITTRKKADGHNGFPNNFIEKEIGVPATTRNWNTVRKLVE